MLYKSTHTQRERKKEVCVCVCEQADHLKQKAMTDRCNKVKLKCTVKHSKLLKIKKQSPMGDSLRLSHTNEIRFNCTSESQADVSLSES